MTLKGIYKLTSPSGSIYIGYSTDINKRWSTYKSLKLDQQPRLLNSLSFHGPENFKFEIIHQLPEDVEINILKKYEVFYIAQYKECGFEMLNCTNGGDGFTGGKHSEETKRIISFTGTGRKHPPRSDEFKKEQSKRIKEFYASARGKKRKEEQSNISEEEIKIRSERSKKTSLGRKHTEETKLKIGQKHKGKIISVETRKKFSEKQKGKKLSPESIKKRTETRRKNHLAKKID